MVYTLKVSGIMLIFRFLDFAVSISDTGDNRITLFNLFELNKKLLDKFWVFFSISRNFSTRMSL